MFNYLYITCRGSNGWLFCNFELFGKSWYKIPNKWYTG